MCYETTFRHTYYNIILRTLGVIQFCLLYSCSQRFIIKKLRLTLKMILIQNLIACVYYKIISLNHKNCIILLIIRAWNIKCK